MVSFGASSQSLSVLNMAFASAGVQRVLNVWKNSGVQPDRAAAIGLRHAAAVEVRDWAYSKGWSFDDSEYFASFVAVGRRNPDFGKVVLQLACSWQFTENGDDPTGEWERWDVEVS